MTPQEPQYIAYNVTYLEIAGAKLQNNVHLCLRPTYTCLPQKSLKGIILMDCKTIGSLNMSNRLDHSTIAFPT
ncbi:hypothetical protein PS15p_202007 [Mucor circinelloides]